MSRIERPRQYQKKYMIQLCPNGNPNFIPLAGSANSGTYNVDIRNLMSQDEADRPFFVEFNFSTASSATIHADLANGSYILSANFNTGQLSSIRGGIDGNSFMPLGSLFFQDLANNEAMAATKTNDNLPVWIGSLANLNSITVVFSDQSLNLYDFGGSSRTVLNLWFYPADIPRIV